MSLEGLVPRMDMALQGLEKNPSLGAFQWNQKICFLSRSQRRVTRTRSRNIENQLIAQPMVTGFIVYF